VLLCVVGKVGIVIGTLARVQFFSGVQVGMYTRAASFGDLYTLVQSSAVSE
jgi:hypothetical protein